MSGAFVRTALPPGGLAGKAWRLAVCVAIPA